MCLFDASGRVTPIPTNHVARQGALRQKFKAFAGAMRIGKGLTTLRALSLMSHRNKAP
jgi:hypothetical protein